MDKSVLYQEIAESVRQQIMTGELQPNDRLPTVREMAARWNCTQGTVQRAYSELSRQGLVMSRPGQGTRIVETLPETPNTILRQAALLNRAEAFLLESLTSGYTPTDVEKVMRLTLDRWRAMSEQPPRAPDKKIHFVGSHDPAVALLASELPNISPGTALDITFTGSLSGLMALVRGEADLAGSHLWDMATDTYNAPFVRRLLPGRKIALVTLAHRRLGLIVPKGNPAHLQGLKDLPAANLHFATRQYGTGTRVWLDEQLQRLGFSPDQLETFGEEKRTHYQVAQSVAEGKADVGLGIETAAWDYDLEFICLTKERYDLIIPASTWEHPAIQSIVNWLKSKKAQSAIRKLGGYDCSDTGQVEWIQ